jgi:hypothetical protein
MRGRYGAARSDAARDEGACAMEDMSDVSFWPQAPARWMCGELRKGTYPTVVDIATVVELACYCATMGLWMGRCVAELQGLSRRSEGRMLFGNPTVTSLAAWGFVEDRGILTAY